MVMLLQQSSNNIKLNKTIICNALEMQGVLSQCQKDTVEACSAYDASTLTYNAQHLSTQSCNRTMVLPTTQCMLMFMHKYNMLNQ